MKFMDNHWTVGKYSRLYPGKECVCVDWDAVRANAMSQEERLYDEFPAGHKELVIRYRRAVKDRFKAKKMVWPHHIRFKGKLRLFTIRKKFGMLPGLDKCTTAEQVYDMYPDLEDLLKAKDIAPEI